VNRPQDKRHAVIRQAWQHAGLLPAGRPAGRRATPEQCAALRAAQYDLERNGRYEGPLVKQGLIREETDRYAALNDRVGELSEPLTFLQRYRHAMRGATAEERDFARLQRESGRQDRERARTARGRYR
jgi:hypothetical protein